MKHKKRKRIFALSLSIVMLCTVLLGGYTTIFAEAENEINATSAITEYSDERQDVQDDSQGEGSEVVSNAPEDEDSDAPGDVEEDPDAPEDKDDSDTPEDGDDDAVTDKDPTDPEGVHEFNTQPITAEYSVDSGSLSLEAPVGSFPEGVGATIRAVEKNQLQGYVNIIKSVNESLLTNAEKAIAFDITFTDPSGDVVQPENGSVVTLTFTVKKDSDLAQEVTGWQVYHILEDSGSAEKMENPEIIETDSEIRITVAATSFSPYLLSGETEESDEKETSLSRNRLGNTILRNNTNNTETTSLPLHPHVTTLNLQLYQNGEWQPITSENPVNLTAGDQVQVVMNYQIPGDIFSSTKIYTYQLPANIRYAAQSGSITQDGNAVGTYSVNATGLVTFTFNSSYNPDDNFTVNTFTIAGIARYVPGLSENETKFLYGNEQVLIVVEASGDFLVNKSAERKYKESGKDSVITYTVEISSPNGVEQGFTVKDQLSVTGAGILSAAIDPDSFVIKKQDNSIVSSDTYTVAVEADGRSYEIEGLSGLNSGEGYTITYQVDVEQDPGSQVPQSIVGNTVTVESTSTQMDSTQTIYQPMFTKQYAGTTGSGMRWDVSGYTGGQDMTGYQVVDTIEGANFTGVNQIVFRLFTLDENGGEVSHTITGKAAMNDAKNAFVITFPTEAELNERSDPISYSDVYKWEIRSYSERPTDTTITITNKARLVKDNISITEEEATGTPAGYTTFANKNVVDEDTEDPYTIYWSLSADYSGMENYPDSTIWIQDGMSSQYWVGGDSWRSDFTNENPHYGIASELEAVIRSDENGIRITETVDGVATVLNYSQALESGYTFNVVYHSDYNNKTDATAVQATDDTTRVKAFEIRVRMPTARKQYVTNISVEKYPTHFDRDQANRSLTYRVRNYVATRGNSRYVVHPITNPESTFKKLVQSVENLGTYTSHEWIPYGYGTGGSTLIQFQLIAILPEGQSSIEFRDVLPEGLRLAGNVYADGRYAEDSTIVVAPMNEPGTEIDLGLWTNREGNVNVTYDESSREIVVNIENIGEEGMELNASKAIDVIVLALVDGDLSDMSGTSATTRDGQTVIYKNFINTATANGIESTATATVYETGEVMTKGGERDGDTNRVNYSITINPDGLDLLEDGDTLTLTDTVTSKGLSVELDWTTIKLYKYVIGENGEGEKGDEVEIQALQVGTPVLVEGSETDMTQSFTMTIDDGQAYILEYTYQASNLGNVTTRTLSNQADINGVISTQSDEISVDFSSSATSDNGSLRLYKVDAENYANYLTGALFRLEQFNNDTNSFETIHASFEIGGSDGKLYDYLNPNETLEGNTLYRIVEYQAPAGYSLGETPFTYYFIIKGDIKSKREDSSFNLVIVSNEEAIQAAYGNRTTLGTGEDAVNVDDIDIAMLGPSTTTRVRIENEKIPDKELTIQKVWDDEEDVNRPDSIQVQIYQKLKDTEDTPAAYGDVITISLEDDNWTKTITGLPAMDTDGNEFEYSVKEVGEDNNKVTLGRNLYRVAYDSSTAVDTVIITNERIQSVFMPQTGMLSTQSLLRTGLLLIMIGSVYLLIRKKRRRMLL